MRYNKRKKKINILITGINGFIGRNLKEYLERHHPDYRLYGVDIKHPEKYMDGFYKVDISDTPGLKKVIRKINPRYIFHLGGVVEGNFHDMVLGNIAGTYSLIEAVREAELKKVRIIIPSSASEYGNVPFSAMPIKEARMLAPLSPYGVSKMAQTALGIFYAAQGMDIVTARIFNIVGKGMPINLALGKFAYQLVMMKNNRELPVIHAKNLSARRDFLDISDVCRYLLGIALKGKAGQVYNVCRGKSYEMRLLVKKLISLSGLKGVKIIEEKRYYKDINVTDSFGSVRKLHKIIRPFELIPIEVSLRDTYSYYLSRIL